MSKCSCATCANPNRNPNRNPNPNPEASPSPSPNPDPDQVCNHPYLFFSEEQHDEARARTPVHIWRSSGKFELLDSLPNPNPTPTPYP